MTDNKMKTMSKSCGKQDNCKWLIVMLLLSFVCHFVFVPLQAKPDLSNLKRYHIVCQQFAQGCVTDGATAGQSTPLFYLSASTTSNETWWIFTEESEGLYSIKNAKTNQYITYDGVRSDISSSGELRRYLNMTAQTDGYNSLWTIEEQAEGVYIIRNAQQQDHIWDVRTDSYCVGTYSNSGTGNQNQLFSFYDAQGAQVYEKQATVETSGFDVSSWFVATTDNSNGWSYEGTAWTDPGFGTYRNGNASVVSPFLERWNDTNSGPLPNCALYQTLSNLPAGSYTLQADIIAVRQASNNNWYQQREQTGYGVYLFANDQNSEAGTSNERPESYTVTISLEKTGPIQAGIRVNNTNANWVATDNFKLFFNGSANELIEGEKEKVRIELSDYYNTNEIDSLITVAGDNFEQLEILRKSVSTLPAVDPLTRLAGHITIDGQDIVYVESTDLYLCTIPIQQFGEVFLAQIIYDEQKCGASLAIDGTSVASENNYSFSTITGNKEYTLTVTTEDGRTISKPLTFTSLPIVKIYGSFNNSYSEGRIIVHEANKPMPQLMNMKAKWRGGITNNADKHKRNYHVKLLDENGEKLEESFFGLRNDNSWILESCQVDMSRIRNRVLTDLWNDYSQKPYYFNQEPKARTGTRGQFVELILNDEYRGIYCMTENMDRKQLKLKKYDEATGQMHGQLWKSKDWSYAVFMGHNKDYNYYPGTSPVSSNDMSESWDQYYVKYPDFDDVQPTDWSPLYKAVDFVCTSNDNLFSHYINDYIDLPLLIDYYILMETILSTDNHGKNMFFACYDQAKSTKITFAVWDMDATCGQRWSDAYYHADLLRPEQDYAEFITYNEHGDYNLFKRMRETNAYNFNEEVRLRYRDLRQNYLATENILNRFRTYLNEFKTCGAAEREYAKWNGDTDIARLNLDFDVEMDYLTDWFTRRMNYLDTTRFDIASLPPSGINDQIMVTNNSSGKIYDVNGRYVGERKDLDELPRGLYIIDGKKIVK